MVMLLLLLFWKVTQSPVGLRAHPLSPPCPLCSKNTGPPGVSFQHGQSWVEQRRFALRTLRNFGFGKAGMEEMIAEEVEALCAHLEERGGEYVQMGRFFNRSALSAVWRVLTGEEDLDRDRQGQT